MQDKALAKREHDRMQSDFIKAFTRKLEAAGFNLDDFQSCSAEEIAAAMAAQGVTFLPAIYIGFLQLVGHGSRSRRFAWDMRWTYKNLLIMKELFLFSERLETVAFSLRQDAFVFLSSEDYVFWYFHTELKDENPAIYLFREGNLSILEESLFEFLSGFHGRL